MNINLKNLCGVAMLAVSLPWLAGTATAAGPDPALKAALEARYAAMKLAIAAHDGAAIKPILAPGFSSVDIMNGTQNAAQMIAAVAAIPPDPHRTSVTAVLSYSGSTTGLIVKQRYDMKRTQSGPDRAPHQVELVSLSTDTWVKPGAVWLLEKTVTDDMTLYRDGKLAAHRARTK